MIINFDDRWTLEGRRMLMASYDDAILSLLALQISLRIGKHAASMDIRIGQDLKNLATQAYIGANLDKNLADALPALASYIFSKTSPYPIDKPNAAFICIAFLERIKLSIDQRVLSPLLRETLSSCLPQLLSGFGTLESQELDMVRLSTVAIGCFRALRQLTLGSYDAITMEILCNTLQYAVVAADRSPKLADAISVDDYLLEFLEWVGLIVMPGSSTLRSEMRKHPRIIARIAMALKASPEAKRGRWIHLINRNLTELVGKRNLSVWEDAELGTHAVGHLRKMVSYIDLTSPTIILRHLISLSVDCSTELLAAEIIDVIAEVSKTANRLPLWGLNSLQGVYMELLDLILKIWDAALRSRSVRSICWPADSTLDAMGILLPHVDKLEVFSRDSRANFSSLPKLPLLVDYLRKRKPETAFIARNLDVSINRLIHGPESRFGWSYLLYTDQRPSSLCSQAIYIDNELL
ncbi:hypothetical protein FRC00_009466 [Tulasnella sp. 408]|nr:hypothetical protein FRC00_009466 [Tulasnella sp. 408]